MKELILNAIAEAETGVTGPLAVGVLNLQTGETVLHRGDTPFPLASVYKIFTLCELYRQAAAGKISLDDRVVLHEQDKSIGSGVLELADDGTAFSLRDYARLMMEISDNTASDYLFGLVGAENIRRHILEPLGLENTRCDLNCASLLTRYYGVTAEEYRRRTGRDERFDAHRGSYFACTEPQNDQSTPRELLTVLQKLHTGTLIDRTTDAAILEVMRRCQTNDRLPARLPDGVTVAHKTGSIDHLCNDVGIVTTAFGSYAVVLSYNGNLAAREEYLGSRYTQIGDNLLAGLSRTIYDIFCKAYGGKSA